MTSKFVIDVAKIKEERKQYASKLELYAKIKLKKKKVQPLVKFDELKKFKALEEIADEPSIPVEQYGDPTGLCILDPEQYQCIWNATAAFKRTIHRKGQANLKISNILKFSDYDKEEKQSMGLNLLYLMSTSTENTADCMNILDQWVFDWHPTYLQVCVVFENLGVDVRKELNNYYIPNNYQQTIESTKIDFSEFNSKASSSKVSELNSACLSNVLTYVKSILGHFSQEEIQSILILLSTLSLDRHCIELKETFNELLNKCFGCLETNRLDRILNSLYMKIENSMYQCYFVNKVLNPCNNHCKPFAMDLSYLFMCNLLYNHDLTIMSTSLNASNNNRNDTKAQIIKQMDLRSKRKLVEDKIVDTHSSPKKLQLGKEQSSIMKLQPVQEKSSPKVLQLTKEKPSPKKLKLGKEKLLLEKENKKLHNVKTTSKSTRKHKGKLQPNSENPKQVQRSILDYMKRRDKSPDLSKIISSETSVANTSCVLNEDTHNTNTVLKIVETARTPTEHVDIPNSSQEPICILDSCDEDTKPNLDETFANCDQRELIFRKYKPSTITFPVLLQRIRNNLQDHLDAPIRIYRIVNLLNNIVQLLVIDESNMSMCKLLMQELSYVQYKYYGLHDMHRHLVCVYLQQYTTMWGACINRIQYQMSRRIEDYDSE